MEPNTQPEKPVEIYAIPQLPVSYVVRFENTLWIVPAQYNGWKSKRPYQGHDPARMPKENAQRLYQSPLFTKIPEPT